MSTRRIITSISAAAIVLSFTALLLTLSIYKLSDANIPGFLCGLVRNETSGRPIPNVYVYNDYGQYGITDLSGNYMVVCPPGGFTFYWSKSYYTTKSSYCYIYSNDITIKDVFMRYTGDALVVNNPCYGGCGINTNMYIYWSESQNHNYVFIKLFTVGGCTNSVEKVIASETANDGYYKWYISGVTAGEKFLRICAQDVCDDSERFYIY